MASKPRDRRSDEGKPRRGASADGLPAGFGSAVGAVSAARFLWPLIERLDEGVLLFDNGKVALANRAAAFLLGREPEELTGRRASELCAGRTDLSRTIEAVAEGRAMGPVPCVFERPDGGVATFEVRLSTVSSGRRTYAMVRLGEGGLDSASGGEARRAQRMELTGQLAGGVAHDFNNLLTALEAHLDIASAGGDEVLRQGSLRKARQIAVRAAGLSRRLMDFTRHDRFEPRAIPAADLVRGMVPLLQSLLRPGISLALETAPDAYPVLADPSQMEQALMNLALNAQDAMPEGGKLTVRVENQELGRSCLSGHPWARPGRYARIDVIDTGSGIPFEHQPRIFEPFFTRKPGSEGTGLGLSVVYGIVKQHRGFIHVESRPGEGTAFWILLPAADPALDAGADPAPAAREAIRPVVDPTGGTILLVEDEDMVREVAATRLGAQGFRILAARNAREAEELFAAEADSIRLLVTDLGLPGRSGLDLARDLLARKPSLDVLYTSGYDVQELPRHLRPEPGARLLQKPYTLQELARRVEETIRGGSTG